MLKVELKEGTSVFTSDGKEVGRVNRFVLDPQTKEVTHLVLEKGWLLSEDKVVPFDRINRITDDRVVLNVGVKDFDELPAFEETYYVHADSELDVDPQFRDDHPTTVPPPAYYWYPPHGYIGFPAYGLGYGVWPRAHTRQNIPADSVSLKEGANVMSSEGDHVGDVERLFLERDSNEATHFLISQGMFFKDHKLVPADWVRSVQDDKVQLSVSSRLLESLPSYEAD